MNNSEYPLESLSQLEINLMAENQRLLAEVERLRKQLADMHYEQDQMHDLMRGGQ